MDGNGIDPATRDLAIRTIIGEAGGEPPTGQAGVASVLKNRLQSGQYGTSLSSVILAPKQFSLWNPGDPAGRMANSVSPSSPQYQHVGQIFDGVMNGSIADPTGGATHYYNPHSASPAWGPQLAQQNDVTIGNHRFVGTGAPGPGSFAKLPEQPPQGLTLNSVPPVVQQASVPTPTPQSPGPMDPSIIAHAKEMGIPVSASGAAAPTAVAGGGAPTELDKPPQQQQQQAGQGGGGEPAAAPAPQLAPDTSQMRQQQIAAQSQQMMAMLMQQGQKPLSWGSSPYGASAGQQRLQSPLMAAGQMPPGTTLNSGGQQYG